MREELNTQNVEKTRGGRQPESQRHEGKRVEVSED